MIARACVLSALLVACTGCEMQPPRFDAIVYGGTSGGVIAAAKVAELGKSVLLIEPGRHVGGMTSSGLGATDIGNKAAIGGMAREFYRMVGREYGQEEAWTFEPHVAENVFVRIMIEKQFNVQSGRLDLDGGVVMDGNRIDHIILEGGSRFAATVFIDATYEGDLMALAGVSYTVGREANTTYAETLNGVQTENARHHQFVKEVDPYVVAGDPSSGLLPGIDADGPGAEGAGDRRVQAYNYRLCATDVP
ncbi:MAG: FAD-dependent oxidoreductase, partial [Phycisphaerae bacterium]|nr:FAD-dependent oxidoreductase [Phycisphaerae bacterium]